MSQSVKRRCPSRSVHLEKHLVFCRLTGDGIEIVRVLHGARDIDRILDSHWV
jgi:plasmid stabilization system protein ParE